MKLLSFLSSSLSIWAWTILSTTSTLPIIEAEMNVDVEVDVGASASASDSTITTSTATSTIASASTSSTSTSTSTLQGRSRRRRNRHRRDTAYVHTNEHQSIRFMTSAPSPSAPIRKCKKYNKTPSKGTNADTPARRRRRRMAVPGIMYNTQVAERIYQGSGSILKPKDPNAAPSKGTGTGSGTGRFGNPNVPSKGKGVIWIDDCEAPSTSPSFSPRPSPAPSSSPTDPPTKAPTSRPSSSPTLSMAPSHTPTHVPSVSPTTSPQPTTSPAPSSSPQPTQNPTMTFSPGCQALKDGEVYRQGSQASNEYYYQLVTSVDANMTEVLGALDSSLKKAIGYDLIFCGAAARDGTGAGRARSLALARVLHQQGLDHIHGVDFTTHTRAHINTQHGHGHGHGHGRTLRIDGLDMQGPDEDVEDYTCNDLVDIEQGQECRVYKGSFKVYYRDGTYSAHQALQQVLERLQYTMNNEQPKQLMLAEVEGAFDINYGEGVPPNGGGGGGNDSPYGVVIGDDPNKRAVGLSGVGIAMVASASIVGILFLFAVTRRKEHSKLQVMEQIMEDDESIFDKSVGIAYSADGTELVAGSTSSRNGDNGHWRHDRVAHVLGDEDSVYSGMDERFMDKQRLYGMGSRSQPLGPKENDLGLKGSALNVHSCTSATCQICARESNSPTFVPTEFGMSGNEYDEYGDDDHVCPEAVTPMYSDTVDIDMAERPYASPNTVEM